MDRFIIDPPYLGSNYFLSRKAVGRELTDDERIKYFRVILSDVIDAERELGSQAQGGRALNMLTTVLGMGVFGEWFVGFGAARDAQLSQHIGMRLPWQGARALRCLLRQFHQQTNYQYARFLERWFPS